VEIYSEKRYITVTFQTIKDGNTGEDIGNVPLGDWQTLSTIIDAQALLPFSTGVDEPSMPTGLRNDVAALLRYPPDPLTEQDHNLIKIAARAKNGEKFKSLARGEWEGKYPSQSEADLALCNIVAFYTDDVAQVARIFHASALGQRRDAYQAHYLIPTLNRAFDRHNRRLPTVSLTSLGGA
jgi:hypothetical protein